MQEPKLRPIGTKYAATYSWRNTEPRDERTVAASSTVPSPGKVPRRNLFIELFRQDVDIVS